MDANQIDAALKEPYDSALIHFAYADYLRDFQMYFYLGPTCTMKYRFVNCVSADSATTLPPKTWARSLDDQLIGDLDAVAYPFDGWVWATRYGNMDPGAELVRKSHDADTWSRSLGIQFYEAVFVADPIRVRLIFSDLIVEPAKQSDSPFTVDLTPEPTRPLDWGPAPA